MSGSMALVCQRPSEPPELVLRDIPLPLPQSREILIKVLATSVNPIDIKRATGYGSRLLKLRGAGTFPLNLGSDVAGEVISVGEDVKLLRPSNMVFGALPTGTQGAHTTHVVAQAQLFRLCPSTYSIEEAAAMPYTFSTLWLALRSVGLTPTSAKGRRVLVHGASGGLGQLALQVLSLWGAKVTAVCSTPHVALCMSMGAEQVLDRLQNKLSSLPCIFDATLNFAAWSDDEVLVSKLKNDALGHATTVHPLLASFDQYGWIGGAARAVSAYRLARHGAQRKGRHVRYAWTVYRPDQEAMDALADLMARQRIHLPLGITASLRNAREAFEHVQTNKSGRAVLLPQQKA